MRKSVNRRSRRFKRTKSVPRKRKVVDAGDIWYTRHITKIQSELGVE